MVKLLLTALLAGAPLCAETLETPLPGDAMETTIHRLSNGLTVYLSPSRLEPRIAAQIVVRAGSKHDPAAGTGMAHYLEHMLFKGSAALGTLDYAQEKPHLDRISALYEGLAGLKDEARRAKIFARIDAESIASSRLVIPNELAKAYRLLGALDLNAYTSDDQTVYLNNIPSNRLEAWARLEADRFTAPVFRLFQAELEAVYEEKNRALDDAELLLGEAVIARLFKDHPYARPTLGLTAHLKDPSLARMRAFYERYYVPGNMAIALSGDFDRAETLELLERHFGAWRPKLPPPPLSSRPAAKPKGVERLTVFSEVDEKVELAWMTPPHGHPDADVVQFMDLLMDNGSAGIVNVLDQAQRVKSAGTSLVPRRDAGSWHLWAEPKPGQTLEETEALLLEAVSQLKAGAFSDEDMQAVLTNFELNEKGQLESNVARSGWLVSNFIWEEPWSDSVGRLARLRRITRGQIMAAAKKYLGEDRVAGYRRQGKPAQSHIAPPGFTKVEIDSNLESKLFREVTGAPARPLEPRWLVEGRDYTVTRLPEGRLFAVKNPVNDLFTLTWEFDLNTRTSRKLCAALGLLAHSGAGPLSAEEVERKLYAMGVSYSHSCSEQDVSVTLSGLDRSLWPALELLRLRFDEPNAAPEMLKDLIHVTLDAYEDSKHDPSVVHQAMGELAARGGGNKILQQLTAAEVSALKIGELQELARDLMRHRRRIAYTGNRPPGEIARLIDQGLPSYKEPPRPPPVRYLKPPRDRVWFLHRDMAQASVGLFAGDEVLEPGRFVDYSFFTSYMNGGTSAVLFQELREARSLTYWASGGYRAGFSKGDENHFYGLLECQAEKTAEAASLLKSLFRAPPLNEARFQETARAVEQGYRSSPLSFRGVAGNLMAWEDQGFTGDPRPKRFERLLAYRLADFEAFARRMKDKPLTLFVLGDSGLVDLEALKKLGAFEEKQLSELFPY